MQKWEVILMYLRMQTFSFIQSIVTSWQIQPGWRSQWTTLPNPDLRPMRVAETEIGLELKMFKSRVGLDVAAYRKITTDQIVQAQISDASGFIDTRINSGKSENKGIELLLNIVPIETFQFHLGLYFQRELQ